MSDLFSRFSNMVAADIEPTLDSGDLELILNSFPVIDADGFAPSDAEWTPTYNLRAAAAEGWRWKMGRVAHLVSSDLDGDRMSSNQLFEHCERMVRKFSAAASPSLGQGTEDDDSF